MDISLAALAEGQCLAVTSLEGRLIVSSPRKERHSSDCCSGTLKITSKNLLRLVSCGNASDPERENVRAMLKLGVIADYLQQFLHFDWLVETGVNRQ